MIVTIGMNKDMTVLFERYKGFQLPKELGHNRLKLDLHAYYVKQRVVLGKNPGRHTVGCVVIGLDPFTNKWCRGVSIASAQEPVVSKGYGKYQAFKRWQSAMQDKEKLVLSPLPNSEAGSRFKSALAFYGNDFKEQYMAAYDVELNEFEQKIVENAK